MAINKNKIIAAAQKYIQRGAYAKAIREYRKIIEDDPRDVRTLLKIGDLYVKKGEPLSAAETYEQVAQAYSDQGFYLKAVAVYKQILKVDPAQIEINRKLAELYHQLGLLSECMSQYQTLAAHYEREGAVDETVRIYQRMVELDPENVASRVKLAELYSKEQRTDDAVLEFERACEQLQAQGRTEDYIKVAERLLFLDPGKIPEARRLARVYLKRGDTTRALAKLQVCFKADPRDIDTLQLLADAFRELGQTQKTVSVLKELAKIYQERGRSAEHDETWRRVLEYSPSDADARAAMSRATGAPPVSTADDPETVVEKLLSETDVYLKYGLFQKARDHVEHIFRLSPEHVGALDRLAEATSQLGDRSAAVGALLRLAVAHREDAGQARAALVRARGLDPANPQVQQMLEDLGGGPAAPASGERLEILGVVGAPVEASGGAEIIIVDDDDGDQGAGEYNDETVFGLPPGFDLGAPPPPPPPRQQPVPREVPAQDSDAPESAPLFAEAPLRPIQRVVPSPGSRGPEPAVIETLDADDLLEELGDEEPASVAAEDRTVVASFPPEEGWGFPAVEPRPTPTASVATPVPSASALRIRSDGDVASEMEEAEFFLQQGLLEEARLILGELARVRPNRPEIARRLAEVEARLNGEAPPPQPAPEGHKAIEVEEVFEELSSVVEEPPAAEDSETHYDLGIAYKEMGLLDDAIHEFRLAMRSPERELAALERIGACLTEKGAYEEAVTELKQGLASPRVTESATTELYFGLGAAYEGLGDQREALYYYRRVASADRDFRDVQQRLERLSGALPAAGKSPSQLRRPG